MDKTWLYSLRKINKKQKRIVINNITENHKESWDYYVQLYTNKLDNLEEMYKAKKHTILQDYTMNK